MALYSFLLSAVLILGLPYWLFRMALSGRYRAGLGGRLGIVPSAFQERVAQVRLERRAGGGQRPLMWIHAVSVGEILAAVRLIEELRSGEFRSVRPGMVYAVSTTTEAGKKLAEERLPDCAIFYFPLDLAFIVRRYLDLLCPEMVLLIESELWPRLIAQCHERGIPVAVANARISDRSFPRYMRFRALWRPTLEKISIFLAQSAETAERLRKIGAPRVELAGNLKYDTRPVKETPLVTAVRARINPDSVVAVCGSTLDGEEAIVLNAWSAVLKQIPNAVLVIAPRRPDRFDRVAALIESRGFTIVRASTYLRAQIAIRGGSVLLLDTIGDLASMYGAASVAFVGGSLIPAGGHNPLEPARFGVPTLIGESFENFREIVEAMQVEDGIRVVTPATLAATLIEMIEDSGSARMLGERGRSVSAAQTGAAARMARALGRLLPARSAAMAGSRR